MYKNARALVEKFSEAAPRETEAHFWGARFPRKYWQ